MNFLKRLAFKILLLVNLCVALMMSLCGFFTDLSPTDYPWMAVLGLSFPCWLLLNFICMFLWLLLDWKFVGLSFVGLLFSFPNIWELCPMNWPKDDTLSHQNVKEDLKVMTYNTAFYNYAQKDVSGRYPICDYIENASADILCLQEAKCLRGLSAVEMDARMRKRGYKTKHIGLDTNEYLRVYSKLPILSVRRIPYASKVNGSVAVELLYEGDTLLLVNNHFESYAFTEEDKNAYREVISRPELEDVDVKSKRLLKKLYRASRRRGEQVDAVCDYIKKRNLRAVIVCGDFNEPPLSYSCKRFSSFLESAYSQSGVGWGLTYNRPGFTFRIDHIFVSDYWESQTTFVDQTACWSDHFPLITYLKKK